MTAFRVEFLFEIGSPSVPLEVSREVLGRSFTLSHDGLPVQITLPRQANDFLFWRPFVPGEYRALIDWGARVKCRYMLCAFLSILMAISLRPCLWKAKR